MGKEQLAALANIIETQLAEGIGNPISGTWSIRYDGEQQAFHFDKCEFGGYCEERPTVIGLDGTMIDPGGPIIPPDD